jgi:hypothetical protein
MLVFMGNPCGYGNCMSTECEKCPHYKPTFFGIRVPRWLGNLLFKIEFLLYRW